MTTEPIFAETEHKPKEDTRRRRIWRRVRRTGYALGFLSIAIPLVAFHICYQLWDVPDPAEVEAGQNQTITLYYSDGRTELARIGPPGGGDRTMVRFEDIPLDFQHAVLAAEDNSFWDNNGFDVTGIARAAWNNITGASGGGSTITQQYVKKATGNEDRSFGRKWRELVLAKKMSDTYRKQDVLTAYLNTVYFGRGATGAQAAAQAYFGKDLQLLNTSEAALLAGVIQRPTFWDPDVDRANAERRWNFVLDQMTNQGWLDAGRRQAMEFPATLPRNAEGNSARLQIQNQVLAELEDLANLRRDEGHQHGYRVVTTIDRDAQTSTERAVEAVMAGQPDYLRAAVVSIDPRTGGVVAYHGGGDGKGLDYAQTPQEPGTSFGIFVAAAAFERGVPFDQSLDGGSPRMVDGIPFQNPPGVRCSPCSLWKAIQQPVNTAIAALADRIGTEQVAEAAYQAGIPRELRGKPTLGAKPDTRIATGSGSTRVRTIDMASAYATFAAEGIRSTPHFVSRVEDNSGDIRYSAAPERTPALSPKVTWSITKALYDEEGRVSKPGTRAYGDEGANAKAMMIGYTPDLATAVWLGSDQLRPIRNKDGKDITGSDEPAVIWRAVMDSYGADRAPGPAARPVPSTPR